MRWKPVVCAILAVALSGCASDVHIRTAAADRTQPVAGGAVSGGSFELRGPMSSFAVVLFGLNLVALVAHASDGGQPPEAPVLDPGRSVSEQDCTRPIAETGGNLRCR